MNLAVDVFYTENAAYSVAVKFNWLDEAPLEVILATITDVADYVPGEFYKRELPCILAVLNKTTMDDINCIIIDGYVYIDNAYQYGLGGHLYEALEKKIPVIGVAKTEFAGNEQTCIAVTRGKSNVPLYVSAIGVDNRLAADRITNMKGDFRIPSILKQLDKLTKDFG